MRAAKGVKELRCFSVTGGILQCDSVSDGPADVREGVYSKVERSGCRVWQGRQNLPSEVPVPVSDDEGTAAWKRGLGRRRQGQL